VNLNLTKLLEHPKNYILLTTAIIGFVLFLLINQLIFLPLSKIIPSYGILDFEFAWTPEQVLIIFTAWGSSGMNAQVNGIYWDFLYIVGYGLFIFSCILLISRVLNGKFKEIGLWMSLTPLLGGIFDIIENLNLLILLNSFPTLLPFVSFIASLSACVKFGLLILGIAYFFIGLVLLIIKCIKKKRKI
jgi:hypothetical protein